MREGGFGNICTFEEVELEVVHKYSHLGLMSNYNNT